MTTDLTAIAAQLKTAQDSATQIEPITAAHPDFDLNAAYQVAQLNHRARLAEGFRPVGRKIGFTNANIWPTYDVHMPIWGYVYDRTVHHVERMPVTCGLNRFAEPLLEPEIVVRFRSAPPATATAAEILGCLDWIAHGIEIVQSHFPGWKFEAADTIADAALHGALFVGPPRRPHEAAANPAAALQDFTLTVAKDGVDQDRGSGRNVLGSPIAALVHLNTLLHGQPGAEPLQAGEIVTTGTITRALPIRPGETWTTALSGIDLPGLTLTFGA